MLSMRPLPWLNVLTNIGKETTMTKSTKRTIKTDLARLDLSIRHWRLLGEKRDKAGDREMAQQYETDAKDLEALRDAVAKEDFDAACRMADSMDTIVRDQIPLRLYYTLFPNR